MKSLSLSQPHLIVMVGIPGSGKSFFAEKFADTFRAPYASLDKLTPYANHNDAKEILWDQLAELLKTNQSIIVEGCADTRGERLELAKAARKSGYETLFIWVQIDPMTAKSRALRAKTITSEEFDRAEKRFTTPNGLEKPVVVSGKHTYASQAKVVLKKLSAPRAGISTHSKPPARSQQPEGSRRNITIR